MGHVWDSVGGDVNNNLWTALCRVWRTCGRGWFGLIDACDDACERIENFGRGPRKKIVFWNPVLNELHLMWGAGASLPLYDSVCATPTYVPWNVCYWYCVLRFFIKFLPTGVLWLYDRDLELKICKRSMLSLKAEWSKPSRYPLACIDRQHVFLLGISYQRFCATNWILLTSLYNYGVGRGKDLES